MQPVVAAAGVAARAGIALVAGARGVIEISAARPLQEIAADRAALRSCAEAPDNSASATAGKRRANRVVSKIGVADERADPHAAVGQMSRSVEAGKMVDVDQPVGRTMPPFIRSTRSVPAAR